MKRILYILIFLTFSLPLHAQTQLGADIDAEAAGDLSGYSVSLSADGTRLAIGAPLNSGNGSGSGHVRVYQWNGTAWVQQGADINGEAANDNSGWSVSLSADGTRLAIGAINNGGNGSNAGHVRVYQWNGTAWVQQGADINGERAFNQSGYSVSLSADGTRLAIGAPSNDDSGDNSGQVRVYQWNGTAWVQQGADINGEHTNDNSGYSVTLSADGTRLAIDAVNNDGNGNNAGHVRVYQWNGTAWVKQGADIDGEAAGDLSGSSVALSADGTRLAIGAIANDGNGLGAGQVRVYQWNGTAWVKQGADIDGEAAGNNSGSSVALSADGTKLAIGANNNAGNGIGAGHVRLYQWNGTAWAQQGADIDGEAAGNSSGSSVALSADGTRLAIGAPRNADNGFNAGHVRVYAICNQIATATQEMIWTGAVSTDWHNACNWSPNGVPTATNPVTILNVTNDPVIMSGTTAYAFTIAVGNAASLTINSGGELNVLPMNSLSGINLISNSIFTNNGLLSFTPTSTLTLITVNDNATFNNNGTANLNSSSHSITMGGPNAMVNNSATGIINLQGGRGILCINGTTGNVITNQGTINYTGSDYFASLNPGFTLNNSGTIDIRSGSGIAVQGGTLNNLACAKLLMSGRAYDNQYSSITINDGLMVTGNINTTNGSFTNNGVLRYSRLVGGTIDNRWLIVNNDDSRIFTYGYAFNGTVNGIFTDATATTSAGTFTAPNTLVLPCTVTGSRAYYAKVTTSDGTCTYIVPFNYAQPTFGGRAILLQPSCAGGTGNIGLSVSNLPICTPTVTLTFTATGVGATTSPQTVGVHSSAGGRYSLEVNFKAGTYSNFTITHNGYTVTDSRSYTLNEGAPLPTITTTASAPICAGATSFTIPYTATTGSPTVYSISGTGITSVTNRTLSASPITVNLSAPASGSSIDYTLKVGTLFCNSAPVQGSVTVNAIVAASNAGPYQVGNTIELNATGGETYNWSGPNNFTSSLANPMIINSLPLNGGIYTVTATSGNCTSTATTNVVVNGINPCDLVVEYQFVKAGEPYQPLFNLTNGMNINQLTDEVSILAVPVCPSVQIESFNMNIQGPALTYTITQNISPYALFDNSGIGVFGRVLPAGTYTLTVTGYSQDNLQGIILYSRVLNFTILPNSASINTPILSRNTLCGGNNLDITFSISGTYNSENQFKVELSNANGMFGSDVLLGNTPNTGTFIQPIIIGASSSAGTINCSIPRSVEGGSNYRIRVISTDGVSVSPISSAITIHPKDLNLVSPTNDYITNIGTKQALQKIMATNKINSTGSVIYQAGKSVVLNAGFEAKIGGVFEAKIGGCNN